MGRIGAGSSATLVVVPSGANLLYRTVAVGRCSSSTAAIGWSDDPQGAIANPLGLQLGLCAACWGGHRLAWTLAATGSRIVGLAGLQLTVVLVLGELSHHLGFAPHVSLIRAWGVVAPLAVVWVLRWPRLTVSPSVPGPVLPLPQPG